MLEVGLEEPVEVENGDARAPRVLSATLTGRTHFRRPIFPNERWCQLRDPVRWPLVSRTRSTRSMVM
jgi:hypothetical protein